MDTYKPSGKEKCFLCCRETVYVESERTHPHKCAHGEECKASLSLGKMEKSGPCCRKSEEDPTQWSVVGNSLVRYSESGSGMKVHFDSELEARAKYRSYLRNGRCVECGDILYDRWTESIKSEILLKRLCFTCLHWTRLIEGLHPGDERVVVDGRHYIIGPEENNVPGAFRGFGGAKYEILFTDGRKVVTTNLWTQGTIPERFRNRLPDNATFK